MEPTDELADRELCSAVWSKHPDALILAAGDEVVDANPTTEQLFGHPRSWLVGKPTSVLVPRSILATSPRSAGAPYRARNRDGRSFVAAASLVAGVTNRGQDDLIVVRDVTGLTGSLHSDTGAGDHRSTQLEARERAVEAGQERLTQTLFGAGVALRNCLQAGTSEVSRACVEHAIDLLDAAIAELNDP